MYEAWIWNAQTGLPVIPPLRHSAAVTLVQFSPDGNAVLTASADGTVRVWDVFTGDPFTPPLHGPFEVCDASFSPDGTRVLMACGKRYGELGEVRIWDWKVASKPSRIHRDSQPSAVLVRRQQGRVVSGQRVAFWRCRKSGSFD